MTGEFRRQRRTGTRGGPLRLIIAGCALLAGCALAAVPAAPAGASSRDASVPAFRPAAGALAATDGAACQIHYEMHGRNTGFIALATITNTGTVTVYGWTLSFPLPAGQRLTSSYNATYEMIGTVVAAHNLPDNGVLEPGRSIVVGFAGSSGTALAKPGSFSINGIGCSIAEAAG